MGLGDYNNGDNNKKKYYEPILYSPYGTSNTDGVDPSALSYQFYNGLLKISIAPMLPNAKPDDRQLWDRDNAIAVWLTHVKARMLHDEIIHVLNHPDEVDNGGVPVGNDSLVSFSTGKELGVTSPCLIIRKIDQNDGSVLSVYAYQFKDDYKGYHAVRNFRPESPQDFESVNYPSLEIDNLLTILDEYSRSISGAVAYSVMNGFKYDMNRTNTKFSLIMDKLGIESPDYYNDRGNGGGNKSFFNSNQGRNAGNNIPGSSSMRNTTMEELGNDID